MTEPVNVSEKENKEIDMHVDLYQKKLSKAEWDYMEIPESKDEIEILNLIKKGFSNVNIKYNAAKSIIGILKTSITEEIMVYLFTKYFRKKVEEICEEYEYTGFDCDEIIGKNKNLKIKKIDEMRIENNNFQDNNDKIYEFVLLEIIDKLIDFYEDKRANWYYYYYTLKFMKNNDIENLNTYVMKFVDNILEKYENEFKIKTFIRY
jgi:predicted RNA-binding protein Jag